MARPTIKVLHIEDTPTEAKLIHRHLERARNIEFEVEWVQSLTAGLKRLAEEQYDVVLTDLQLPDNYGLGTLHLVQDQANNLPIVLLTNIDEEQMSINALQAGAQDYLIKTKVDSHWLGKCLRFAIERHRIMSELRDRYEQRIDELNFKLKK